MPRVLWWSQGGVAVSDERGTPVRSAAQLNLKSEIGRFGPTVRAGGKFDARHDASLQISFGARLRCDLAAPTGVPRS